MSNEIYPAAAATSAIRGLGFTVVKRPAFNTLVQPAPNRYETRIAQTQNPVWRWTLTYDVLFDHANLARAGLAYTELRSLVGFFLARLGQYDSFLFSDPDDNYAGPGVGTAGWAASTYYPVGSSLLVAGRWQEATVAGISGTSAPAFSTSGGHVSEGPSSPQLRWDDQGSGYTAVPNLFASLPLVQNAAGSWFSPLQRNLGGFYEDVTDLNGTAKIYANAAQKTLTTNYTIDGPGLPLTTTSYMGKYISWVPAAKAAPVASALSEVASGALSAETYYVKTSYLTTYGETTVSVEGSKAISVNCVVRVASPASVSGVTGWNVYVSTSYGTEEKQNASPLSIGSAWTEPDGGLISGATVPVANTSAYLPPAPITAEFNFYFRVRFETDEVDFEKFVNELWTVGGPEAKGGSGAISLVTSRPPL